jgi:long-chain acyl-CoA synthetase
VVTGMSNTRRPEVCMNIAANLAHSAEAHTDRVAIRLDDAALTYGLLDGATQHVAGLLAERGVGPGDRVGVMLPNVPHFAVLYYGILRAGAVVVPMNPLLKQREVAFYLGNSGAKLCFVWELFAEEAKAGTAEAGADLIVVDTEGLIALVRAAPAVAGVVDRAPDDTAVILYTSGTTGQPKGAELTHANLDRNIDICVTDIEEDDLSSLRLCVSGGAAMPVEVMHAFEAAYKYPRTVRIVDALPKGPTGKILKREIKLEPGQ